MKVVVIGGGIGGLALAAALESNETECVIHERRADVVSSGSGIVLHPNGLAALRRIKPELYAQVATVGYSLPDDTPTYVMADGGRIVSQRVPPPALRPVTILRSDLHRLLYSHATKAEVVCGSSFLRYDSRGTGFRAHVTQTDLRSHRKEIQPDTEAITGDLLVGADGLNSRVRRQLLADGDPVPIGLTSVKCVAKISHDDPYFRGGFVLFGPGQQAFCSPLGPDIVYWDVTVRSCAGNWSHDPVDVQRELSSRHWGWPPFVQDMIAAAEPTEMIVTNLRDRSGVNRWSAGPVTLLGDSAHPMLPFLGQGTNQALLDAVVLAEALATHGSDLPKVFGHYEVERRDAANRAMRESRKIGFAGQSRNPFVRWRRDRAIRRSNAAL
jgi:2-polyprenyl-6-methoxyphenol hydroxylase-like FAD-dependent oxidoreductase